MAKPIPGWIGYDEVSDRPLVKLVGGTKRLLTEDDSGGGGSITSVDDDGASPALVVTDPTGPLVTLGFDESQLENGGGQEISVAGLSGLLATAQTPAAHATSHQNGGSDEISVAGLGGVLADPQIAGSLDTTGAAVDVGASAPGVAGDVLALTDATHANWTNPYALVDPIPAQPHADDLEFNDTPGTVPASGALYRPSAGADLLFGAATAVVATGAPVSGVDPNTVVAVSGNDGTTCRFSVNDVRRSWFWFQPGREAVEPRFALMWPIGSTAETEEVFLVKMNWVTLGNNTSANESSKFYIVLAADLSGAPDTGSSGNFVAMGINYLTSIASPRMYSARRAGSGSFDSNTAYAARANNAVTSVPTFFMACRNAGVWCFYAGSPEGSWAHIGRFTGGLTAVRWVGIAVRSGTINGDFQDMVGLDYIRRYDDRRFV